MKLLKKKGFDVSIIADAEYLYEKLQGGSTQKEEKKIEEKKVIEGKKIIYEKAEKEEKEELVENVGVCDVIELVENVVVIEFLEDMVEENVVDKGLVKI